VLAACDLRGGEGRSESASWDPEIYGFAPDRSLGILDDRWSRALPTVITSGLPVGNTPDVDLAVNDPTDRPQVVETPSARIFEVRGPNRGLQQALEERAAAGWQVPSVAGGSDPDALLVDTGTLSLQQHRAERHGGGSTRRRWRPLWMPRPCSWRSPRSSDSPRRPSTGDVDSHVDG